MFCWQVLTSALIVCVLRYAAVVKKHPEKSPMYHADAYWRETGEKESCGEISHVTTRQAWIVYLLLLVSLGFVLHSLPDQYFFSR